MADAAQRTTMMALAIDLIAHAPQVHYAQARPMREVLKYRTAAQLTEALAEGVPLTMDCSESVTLICKLAGLKDPNGLHYNGQGFTGTMLEHLPHYSKPTAAGTGALVVWGAAPGEHVAMVLEPFKPDPFLFSHGSERGPLKIKLSAESAAHFGQPRTFLSIAGL